MCVRVREHAPGEQYERDDVMLVRQRRRGRSQSEDTWPQAGHTRGGGGGVGGIRVR